MKRPVFAPDVSIQTEGQRVLLVSRNNYAVLEGKLGADLVPLLQKALSVSNIISSLKDKHPAAELHFTLLRLEEDGLIIDAEKASPDIPLWQSLGYNEQTVLKVLTPRRLSIVSVDLAIGDSLTQQLEGAKVQISAHSTHRLVLTSDYLHKDLRLINTEAFQSKQSFLLAKPIGPELWIGPVIAPYSTGCIACLQHRIELNQPARVYLDEASTEAATVSPLQIPPPGPISALAIHIIALETAKWLASKNSFYLEQDLISFDLRTLESRRHRFIQRPQCTECGKPQKKTAFTLSKQWVNCQNNFRIQTASDTFHQYEHLISPITGVVRSLNRVQHQPNSFEINYTAGHAGRTRGHSIESLRLATRDQSGGKGKTDIQAKTSGLCEALERYSAVFDDDSINERATYDAIKDNAIHPNSVMLFSDVQFAKRENWNASQHGGFQLVPERFDETDEIDWTEVWSLSHNKLRYIPTALCYYGFDGPGKNYSKADSNGLASGNCLEEAILFGLLELIERDAVSIWWYNRIRRPEVDMETFNEPYFDAARTYYQSLGRDLWVLDLTNDLEIPTFVAISSRQNGAAADILLGFGAHVDAKTAITRAILEVNQSLPAVLKNQDQRKAQLLPDFADVLNWWKTATLENQPYLVPNPESIAKTAEDYESLDHIDLKSCIHRIVAHIHKLGLETLILNLTRPDVGLSVARVIVPGLRHFWRRLGPGRLYDVPVRMQWKKEPSQEGNLNPISLFL